MYTGRTKWRSTSIASLAGQGFDTLTVMSIKADALSSRLIVFLISLLLPASAHALTVQGNQFVEGGQPVILRGIAMGDVTDLPNDADPYPEIAKEWHANVVRLSIHPGTWRDKKDEALSILKRHVDLARGAGLYVIIDYHVIGFPDGYALDYFDITDSSTKTDYYDSRFTLAMDFWMTVALNYQDPGILYELWNEPSSNTEEEEGGDLAYWKKYRPYWRVLTDAIRASGNNNVVLVAPPLWAFNLRSLREFAAARRADRRMSGTSIPATIRRNSSTPSTTSTRKSRSSSPNGASSPTPSSIGPGCRGIRHAVRRFHGRARAVIDRVVLEPRLRPQPAQRRAASSRYGASSRRTI